MREKPRVVVLLGESGGGKSTVAQQLVASSRRLIVVAPYMKTPYDTLGFSSYEAARSAFLAAGPEAMKEFRISIAAFTPKELAAVCRLAWALAPVDLVLDETATIIPNASAAPDELRYICQIGRHAGHDEKQPVRLLAIGQRPANLPPYLRAEAKEVYVFALASEKDCARVGEDFSLPRETREAVVPRIAALPKYHRLRLTKKDDGGWAWKEGMGA